jgi:transposase-like protein
MPKLAIGDGSLGFWFALQEEYGAIAQQRCWVHKTANILDKMPKSVQGNAGMHADPIPWQGRSHSLCITLSPLSTIGFKRHEYK